MIEKRSIFISDKDYFPYLYEFKNKHPEYDIKVISKDDLLNLISFSFKDDVLPILVKNGYEYSKAKKYLHFIRTGLYKNNQKLQKVYDLLKDHITYDEYGLFEIKERFVYLFESMEDIELKSLLKRNDITFKDLSFNDLGYIPKKLNEYYPYHFKNKYEQYTFLFSDILRKIKEDDTIKNSICIHTDVGDNYYYETISKVFNLEVFSNLKEPLSSKLEISKIVNQIYDEHTFDIEYPDTNDYECILKSIVERYSFKELDFDFAYANLIEILSSTMVKEQSNNQGLIVYNNFCMDPNSLIYVTTFKDGVFYNTAADDLPLTDSELIECDLNPSYVRTELDKRKKANYLKYNNICFLSRVDEHLSDAIYNSGFVTSDKEFDENNYISSKNIIHTKFNPEGLYTKEAIKLLNTYQYDNEFYYKTVDDINSYDHSFKGLNVNNDFKEIDKWYITNIESYLICPFKYLMKTVIKETKDDKHSRWSGVLIHAVMEDINHDDFDFEESFEKGLLLYKEEVRKAKDVFDERELANVETIKKWLLKNAYVLRNKYEELANIVSHEDDHEIEVKYVLDDPEKDTAYLFTGSIDKIIWTVSPDNNQGFYTIVDYKTGNTEFKPEEVFYGREIQLPMYYEMIQKSDNKQEITNGYTFGGFGLAKPHFRKFNDIYVDGIFKEDNISNYAKLTGIFRQDPNYIHSMDIKGTTKSGKISPKSKIFRTKGTFTDMDGIESVIKNEKLDVTSYNFNNLIDDAKQATLNIIHDIQDGKFSISPGYYKEATDIEHIYLPCSNCPYSRICYHTKLDSFCFEPLIKAYFMNEKFHMGSKKEDEDDE